MRKLTPVVFTVVLFASACSGTGAESTGAQSQVGAATTQVPEEPTDLAFSTDQTEPGDDLADTADEARPESEPGIETDDLQNPTSPEPEPEPAQPVTMDDLTRFIAAAEAELVGTSHEGALYAAPEIYIASAQVFCARLSQGDPLGQIVDDYLALVPTPISDDDYTLAGAILGAGIETLCPEHGSEI